MDLPFVADGAQRLLQAREEKLRETIREKYSTELSQAAPAKRAALRLKNGARISSRTKIPA